MVLPLEHQSTYWVNPVLNEVAGPDSRHNCNLNKFYFHGQVTECLASFMMEGEE